VYHVNVPSSPTRQELRDQLRRTAKHLPPVRVSLAEYEARAAAAAAAGLSLSEWIRVRTEPTPPKRRRR